jgi:hypothetical protein
MESGWRPGLPVRTCEICGELVPDSAMRWAVLYINDQPVGLSAQVHTGPDGSALHPERLSGIGGPGIGVNDMWEWRLEG